jgi:phosphotransferase system enzyme I (PtsI)
MTTSVTKEKKLKGKKTASGIVIGKAVVIRGKSKSITPASIKINQVDGHKERFHHAQNTLTEELQFMAGELKDENTREIIETQGQIIRDPEIEKSVFDIIENKLLGVDFAVYQTFCTFIEQLKESGSELFRQRIVDLEDLRDRFIDEVCDQKRRKPIPKGAILVTKVISPTDLVSFYEDGASGLVMEKGGITSHAAIIAKSLGLPCIVNTERATKEIKDGQWMILDADLGNLILQPADDTIQAYKTKIQARKDFRSSTSEGVYETTDGVSFKLFANIEFEAEVSKVAESRAIGVGLLRTESLLFGKRMRNSFEDQQKFYEQILSGTEGPVTIRLFDIGGDKNARRPYKEANPFLGWRGVRLLLDEKELLRNQLKAILVVAGKFPGRVKILVPMVSVLHEVQQIKKEINTVKEQLMSSGIKVDEDVPIGLMVEVPSVALLAHQFAREVDFLSIGSNDLTQYTLAVDRGNEHIHTLFQHYHPSVLKLIKLTAEGAAEAGVELSVCGELAGDEIGAACLLGFGIKELSMVPSSLRKINELLSSKSFKEFQNFSEKAISLSSSEEIEQFFEEWK